MTSMMTRPWAQWYAVVLLALPLVVVNRALAQDRIGLHLRPTVSNVQVGDIVNVRILAVKEPQGGSSFVGFGEAFRVIDLFFSWNPQDLRLLGLDNTGAASGISSSGFMSPSQDFTGTNEAVPPADGTGYFFAQCLWQPVYVTTQGTLVSTLRFHVLRPFSTSRVDPIVSVPSSLGTQFTQVLDAALPGYVSTGTLMGAAISSHPLHPCPREIDLPATAAGVDADRDGFCSGTTGGTDCNDSASDVYPGAPELCDNGFDNDCDGTVDERKFRWFPDVDGDGLGAGATVDLCNSSPPAGYSATGSDNCPNIYNPGQADCDSDGVGDVCELASGGADLDRDGVPDKCQCIADLFIDGLVGGPDLAVVLAQWGATNMPVGDINRSGMVNAVDLAIVLANWGPCQN